MGWIRKTVEDAIGYFLRWPWCKFCGYRFWPRLHKNPGIATVGGWKKACCKRVGESQVVLHGREADIIPSRPDILTELEIKAKFCPLCGDLLEQQRPDYHFRTCNECFQKKKHQIDTGQVTDLKVATCSKGE